MSGGGTPRTSNVQSGVSDVVDQVLDEASSVEPSERAEISVSPIPAVEVSCTSGVLASILGNLVRNAIKFMRDSDVKKIAIRVREEGPLVRFEVEDTGPGIEPGLAETIFQPYVRGQGVTQPGLGLGLATVKRFCEAYGGTVSFRSASGQGSIFTFTLPVARGAPLSQAPPSARLLREVTRKA